MTRNRTSRYDVPVVEVIAPAVRRAVAATRNDRVGLIATAMTVASGAYEEAFAAAPQVTLTSAACPRFVDFVERGVTTGRQLLQLATHYLEPVVAADVDTLVLGCTHYPLLTGMISPLYGLGVGQTNDYVSKQDFVAASAGLLFAWGIGASVGPVVAAPAMRLFGANGLFYFVSACHVLLAGFIAYRMIARRALSAKEQSNFVPVPITQGSYGAPELDPRGEETITPAAAGRAISAAVD